MFSQELVDRALTELGMMRFHTLETLGVIHELRTHGGRLSNTESQAQSDALTDEHVIMLKVLQEETNLILDAMGEGPERLEAVLDALEADPEQLKTKFTQNPALEPRHTNCPDIFIMPKLLKHKP